MTLKTLTLSKLNLIFFNESFNVSKVKKKKAGTNFILLSQSRNMIGRFIETYFQRPIMNLQFLRNGRTQKYLTQFQNILASSPQKKWEVLRNKYLYFGRYGIVGKEFQEVHPEPFLTNF